MNVIDVNGDGRNDIVTTMAHSYGVLWFEQQAGGGWTPRVIDVTWANAHSTAMADPNGDGKLDLIAAKRYWGRNGTDPAEREPMGIYLKMLFAIFTCTPYTGLSTSCVIATWPAMLTSW